MKYFKEIDKGYITIIGTGLNGIEISEEEYNILINIIQHHPSAPSGYDYFLRADTLKWELIKLPPIPEPEDEAAK